MTALAPAATVPVHDFLLADGSSFGLGTKVEFEYWQGEGVFAADAKLGKVLCHEPASEDERRKAAWAALMRRQLHVTLLVVPQPPEEADSAPQPVLGDEHAADCQRTTELLNFYGLGLLLLVLIAWIAMENAGLLS